MYTSCGIICSVKAPIHTLKDTSPAKHALKVSISSASGLWERRVAIERDLGPAFSLASEIIIGELGITRERLSAALIVGAGKPEEQEQFAAGFKREARHDLRRYFAGAHRIHDAYWAIVRTLAGAKDDDLAQAEAAFSAQLSAALCIKHFELPFIRKARKALYRSYLQVSRGVREMSHAALAWLDISAALAAFHGFRQQLRATRFRASA